MASSSHTSEVNPGPLDISLLTLQGYHVSELIWRNRECKEIVVKRCASAIWKRHIHPAVQVKLVGAGFYGVYKSGMPRLDCALVTALVERWRPETHTFHLPIGEATITLEDVGVLWGLPIDGPAVSGEDRGRRPDEWRLYCYDLFGVDLGEATFSQNSFKIKPLVDALEDPQNELPANPTQQQSEQRARLYIAIMLGGLLFSDTSGNKMKTMFLPLLSDFNVIGTYSWGSAALANLYQGLCRATKQEQYTTSGPFILLQLWAWERLAGFRPNLKANAPLKDIFHPLEPSWHLPDPPRAYRWYCHANHKNISTYTLAAYRDQLDRLQPEQFIWRPYILYELPEYCLQGEAIWRAKVPLICFDVLEYHYPDRVMRQFGFEQLIPSPPNPVTELHIRGAGRRGRGCIDYKDLYKEEIGVWIDRLRHTVDGVSSHIPMDYNDEYMQWYRPRTRLLIGRPEPHVSRDGYVGLSASAEHMAQFIGRFCNEAPPYLTGTPDMDELQAAMNRWYIQAHSTLVDAGQEGRILPRQHVQPDQPYMPQYHSPDVEIPIEEFTLTAPQYTVDPSMQTPMGGIGSSGDQYLYPDSAAVFAPHRGGPPVSRPIYDNIPMDYHLADVGASGFDQSQVQEQEEEQEQEQEQEQLRQRPKRYRRRPKCGT